MASTALQGSKSELDIAATQLAEQDKVASLYLSEYAQSISKYSQKISLYSQAVKKYSEELNLLQNEYQELIYSLRGELPNKTQLKDSEKKLASIKQVVQN